MYNDLAKYYDALVKDDESTKLWLDFFNKHKNGETILELASGTGEITLALANDYLVDASDISEMMLDQIKSKDIENLVNKYLQLDMSNFNLDITYDNIICFCDSINYLLDIESLQSMFKTVYNHLKMNGVFMFDMHSLDRLDEFKAEYIEVGKVLNTDYQWSISKEDDLLFHHFAFYEDDGLKQEYHIQKVFNPLKVINLLEEIGFKLEIYTDFNKDGIVKGEKIFIVGRK